MSDRQTDLSKVTVSFPVRQLFWNQKRLCYLPHLLIGQLVFWMVSLEMCPAWSLSSLIARSPAVSNQSNSEVNRPKIERLTALPNPSMSHWVATFLERPLDPPQVRDFESPRVPQNRGLGGKFIPSFSSARLTSEKHPDQSEANLPKPVLPGSIQPSREVKSLAISLLAVERPKLTPLKKERSPLPVTQGRSLRSLPTQNSQSLAFEKLSPLDPSLVATSACWNLQPAQPGCKFSSSRLTLNLDKPILGQKPFDQMGEVSNNPAPSIPSDPELGVILATPIQEIDPELGLPRLRERILEPLPLPSTVARQPSVYLITRVDYFRTTNVFSGVDPIDDGLIRSGLTLFYAPAIGRNTYLVTSIDGNLVRYGNLGYLNYNELRLRAGVLQRLTPRTFAEIGWSNQQLFATREGLKEALRGDRFLNDNAIRFELSRQDALSTKLALNTFYQFRISFADPDDRSRLINSFISSLSYSLSPSLQTALDYQLAWSHFTQQPRDDVYHQLVARLTYTITSQSQLSVFSGFSFGHSSDSQIDFGGFIVGVGVVVNLPLF